MGNKHLELLKDYTLITIGCIILAFSINYFYLANKLAEGGISGVSIIIHYLTGFELSYIYFIMNIPLLIIGYKHLGKVFIYRTVYCTVILTVFFKIFSNFKGVGDDILIASIYGGVLSGIGMGMMFYGGGSSGGTDIIAKIANKYNGISIGKCLFLIDCLVLSVAAIVFGKTIFMYTMIAVVVSSKVIDLFQEGMLSAKAINIITKNPEIISRRIMQELDRGVTVLNGKGGYTKNDVTLLYCIAGKYQLTKIKRIVKEEDPKAFMTIGTVHEVMGEGFVGLD